MRRGLGVASRAAVRAAGGCFRNDSLQPAWPLQIRRLGATAALRARPGLHCRLLRRAWSAGAARFVSKRATLP
jgi:hypothetical protein